ncbi:unnamed protein product, partial [Candidula unifasciata]
HIIETRVTHAGYFFVSNQATLGHCHTSPSFNPHGDISFLENFCHVLFMLSFKNGSLSVSLKLYQFPLGSLCDQPDGVEGPQTLPPKGYFERRAQLCLNRAPGNTPVGSQSARKEQKVYPPRIYPKTNASEFVLGKKKPSSQRVQISVNSLQFHLLTFKPRQIQNLHIISFPGKKTYLRRGMEHGEDFGRNTGGICPELGLVICKKTWVGPCKNPFGGDLKRETRW